MPKTTAPKDKKQINPYCDVPSFPLEEPTILSELLESTGPFELEIGFGRGRFLLDRAAGNKDVRFLGLETRRKWVHVVAERAVRRDLKNVTVLHGDARVALKNIPKDGCLSRCFINFPDPWWKARHAKRLVIEPETLGEIARLLAPGGELFIQTDVDFRAEAYQQLVTQVDGFVPVNGGPIVENNPMGARSLREIRCEETGLPIYRLLYKRG